MKSCTLPNLNLDFLLLIIKRLEQTASNEISYQQYLFIASISFVDSAVERLDQFLSCKISFYLGVPVRRKLQVLPFFGHE